MNERDERIQNLFDNYADELAPRADLADKALAEMTANKTQPSASPRKKSSFWANLAWIAPIAAVFIAVLVAIFSLPVFNGGLGDTNGEGTTDNVPSQQPTVAVSYYTYADVKGRSVDIADYDDELQLSKLLASGYRVVGQKCYAFYTSDDQLRYIKVYLGLRSADGTFTELELIAEVDGYVRSDLRDIYNNYHYHSGLSAHSDYDDKGEYITQAFFATRDMHFYAVARNGQYTTEARDILTIILDN